MKIKFLLIACLAMLSYTLATAQDYVNYVDASTLTIINKAQDDGIPFQRIDVSKYPDLNEKVTEYYRYSTGLAVMFRTNARNISARWSITNGTRGANTPFYATHGLDLYIYEDGNWIWAGAGKPKAKSAQEANIVSDMDGLLHDCILYLPLFAEISSLQIGIDEGATIKPIDNPFTHKIVIVGSSITHGAGVSRPGMAYPARMERHFGFQFVNLGVSGQFKLDDFFTKVIADTEADAFVFDGFSNPNVKQINTRLKSFVKVVRAAHPNTPLIFLQTEVRESTNFNTTVREKENLKREASEKIMKEIMSKDDNVYFISPAMELGDDHEGTVDGAHPTDLGTERILQALEPKLKAVFDKCGIK